MPPRVRLAEIRDTALSIDEVVDAVRDEAAGGIVVFVGTVRNVDPASGSSAQVERLDYSSHPSAGEQLARVADRVAQDPGVIGLAVVHRVGELVVGDVAVVVAVSAAHRDEAFGAARRLIDEVKDDVPIWKHEGFVGGEAVWVNGG